MSFRNDAISSGIGCQPEFETGTFNGPMLCQNFLPISTLVGTLRARRTIEITLHLETWLCPCGPRLISLREDSRAAEVGRVFRELARPGEILEWMFRQIMVNDSPELKGALFDFEPETVANFAVQSMVVQSWLRKTPLELH